MNDLYYHVPDKIAWASEEIFERSNEFKDLKKIDENFRGEKRLPIEIILDTSSYMHSGEKMDVLNKQINSFVSMLKGDFRTRVTVDVGVITMGGKSPQIVRPLETVDSLCLHQIYEAKGCALFGCALRMAVNEITSRKVFYIYHNIEYYRPIVILLSAGCPSDYQGNIIQDSRIIRKYVDFVKKKTDEKICIFFTGYIGEDNNARNIMKSLASRIKNEIYFCDSYDNNEYIEKVIRRQIFPYS